MIEHDNGMAGWQSVLDALNGDADIDTNPQQNEQLREIWAETVELPPAYSLANALKIHPSNEELIRNQLLAGEYQDSMPIRYVIQDGETDDILTPQMAREIDSIREGNSLESREKVLEMLHSMEEELELQSESGSSIVVDYYRKKVQQQKKVLDKIAAIGSQEYTQLQADSLSDFISSETGMEPEAASLVYASRAEQFLRETIEVPEDYISVEDALALYNFSEKEMQLLGQEYIVDGNLTVEAFATAFDILLNRIRLYDQGWRSRITYTSNINSVSPEHRVINVGGKKTKPGTTVRDLMLHEAGHAFVGAVGAEQPIPLEVPVDDTYLMLEEGVMSFIEMLNGQPPGCRRQRIIAARLVAAQKMMEISNGQAKYTTQQVFEQLTELGIAADDASGIVTRILRGTSGRRGLVSMEINGVQKMIPEGNYKDISYYHGFQLVVDFIREHLPNSQGENTFEDEPFDQISNELLANIGDLALQHLAQNNKGVIYRPTDDELQDMDLVYAGKTVLLTLIGYLRPGKTTYAETIDPQHPLYTVFERIGHVNLPALFQPRDEGPLFEN